MTDDRIRTDDKNQSFQTDAQKRDIANRLLSAELILESKA